MINDYKQVDHGFKRWLFVTVFGLSGYVDADTVDIKYEMSSDELLLSDLADEMYSSEHDLHNEMMLDAMLNPEDYGTGMTPDATEELNRLNDAA